MSNSRFLALEQFAKAYSQAKLVALSGDASFRKYYRAGDVIVLDSDPKTQKNAEFIDINKAMHDKGINTFTIKHYDLEQGFFILEDLGDDSLFSLFNTKDRDALYLKAIDNICTYNALKIKAPSFDKDFITTELHIFNDYMLDKALHLSLSQKDEELLNNTYQILIDNCLAQEQVIMHRDYHSRNLMVKDNDIYIIDYQDSVVGPLLYDLSSLLFDCYIKLDDSYRHKLCAYAFEQFKAHGFALNYSYEEFYKTMCLTAMQRQVKVLGIFCRLAIRDNKCAYLKDLPLVLEYVLYFCSLDQRFDEFKHFLLQHVHGHLPA